MLNEFLIAIDFKGTRPVFLLNHEQRVSADDDQVNFPLSTLFSIGNADGFKDVPTVLFSCRTTDLCQSLLGQFTGTMNVIGRMMPPPFSPPLPPLRELHAVHRRSSLMLLTITVGRCSAPFGSASTSACVASPESTNTPTTPARVAMAMSV